MGNELNDGVNDKILKVGKKQREPERWKLESELNNFKLKKKKKIACGLINPKIIIETSINKTNMQPIN